MGDTRCDGPMVSEVSGGLVKATGAVIRLLGGTKWLKGGKRL